MPFSPEGNQQHLFAHSVLEPIRYELWLSIDVIYVGKRNLEGSLDSSRSMYCSYEFNAVRAAGLAEDVDRNANDRAALEDPSLQKNLGTPPMSGE
jgi:hypothetical protein